MKQRHPSLFRRTTIARIALLALLILLEGTALAQNAVLLPTRGKRFWTGFMQNGFGAQHLRVHIMGSTATSGTVSMPLTGWSTNFTVAANGVAVVQVPTSAENWGSESVMDKGVLIESNDSVNVFISSFQNFTHDLAQVLPVKALGSSYRVDGYHGLPNFNNLHKSELLVVASEDGTEVQITPSVPTLGGQPAGVPFTVSLDAGQTYQVQAATDVMDLTGTLVEATASSGACRPFVVMGGSMCATAPGACSACDVVFEQMVPRSAWGTRYFTVPITGATSSTFRVMADENNTTITIGNGAPITLNAGQRHEVNGNTTPVCIQANKPVSVVQLMEGYSCAGSGDPSLLLLSPADRLSTQALFHTPTSAQLNQHSISLVVPSASIGQVTLNGNTINAGLFQAYPGCADRAYASLSVPAGVHRVQAANGFQLHVFGMGFGESYAAMAHDIAPPPVPQDSVVCGSGPVTLNAPEPLANAIWTAASDPSQVLGTGNSLTITSTQSDSYTVTGDQQASGCPASFTYNVGIPLTIPTNLTANDAPSASVCQYSPVQLALDPPPDPAWFQVQWSPAASLSDPTIANPVASPMTDTWYVVNVTSPSGCGNMVDSVFVQVAPAAVMELSTAADPPAFCLGTSTQLTSSTWRVLGHDPFETTPGPLWLAVQGGAVGASCGSVSGSALHFNGNGQRTAQTVGLNTASGGELRFHLKIADGTAPCDDADPGEDVVLEYSTNNGISWNAFMTFPENAYPTFTPIQVEVPAAAQTSNTMFRLRQVAHTGAGHDNWAVDEFMVVVVDNNWLSYQWNPGNVATPTQANTTATPQGSGWYVLQGTDPLAGCTYVDSVYVQVEPGFGLTVTNDTTLCTVAGIQLQAQAATTADLSWNWGPDNGSLSALNVPDPVATPQQTTTYTVTATSATGCAANAQVTITVGQLLSLDLTTPADTLCQGQGTTLNATAGGGSNLTYSWTNAATLSAANVAAPIATPELTTTYTCTVTDVPSGCSLSGSITIVVNTGYTADAGSDLTLCSTLGHQLGVQHNIPDPTFQWTPAGNLNAGNIQAPSILVDGTATYTVTVSDPLGCSVTDEVTITKAFAGVPATVSAAACADAPPTLTAPANGVSYAWSTGATTASIVPSTSGPHTVTVTDAQGCQAITTFQVALHPLPVVALGGDVSLCGANTHQLNAGNPGSTYAWSNGATTQQITVNSSGTYSVTVTNALGCSASDQVQVQFNPMPVNTLQNATACISDPPILDAGNPGSTYLWSTGAAAQTLTATQGGAYSVTVTTPQGCSATFGAQVELMPLVSVELGPDTSVCQGNTVLLDTGNPSLTHQWNTGATTPTLTVSDPGVYSVSVSNGWCSGSDQLSLTVLPMPVNMLGDVTVCNDQTVELDAGNPGSSYNWSNGGTAQTTEAPASGTYLVTVTNPAGCTATFSAEVTLVEPPVVDLGPDDVLCANESVVLDAGDPGSTYLWNNGETGRTLTATQTGTYSVTVDNGYCIRYDEVELVFNPLPHRPLERIVHICLDEEPRSARLDAGNPGATYQWSTGETSQMITVTGYGSYDVAITNVHGCVLNDAVEVVEYCPSTIYVPNAFTPDGDGINDVFIPVGKNIATMELIIFDRWGGVLFQSNSPDMGWDGTYRGEPVKNDVFVWKLRYRSMEDVDGRLSMERELMGHIQVLR